MMETPRPSRAVLTGRRELADDNLLLTFSAPEIAASAAPGQFVMLQSEAYLRRPFGICRLRAAAGEIDIGIKIKGRGTACFAEYAYGKEVSVLGPLGNGFALDGCGEAYVLGGGTGVYPLIFLLERCRDMGVRTHTVLGFKNKEAALLLDEFKELSDEFLAAAETGGLDVMGYAQTALEQMWRHQGNAAAVNERVLFCCGPTPLLRAATTWASQHNLAVQASLEERMACGFGVCRCCAVELNGTTDEGAQPNYARCCVEGPVFPGEAIRWR